MRKLVDIRLSSLLLVAALGACATDGPSTPADRPDLPKITPSSITLNLSGASAALEQGQSTTLTINVTRTSFNAPIELSADRLSPGVTATFASATLANGTTSTTVTISASSSAAVGSTSVAIRARGLNVEDAVGTLALTVTAAAKNLSLYFCEATQPLWIASQDDKGQWVRAPRDPDDVVRVAIKSRGGVAVAYDGSLEVVYGTVAELATYYQPCHVVGGNGPKTLFGSAAGFASGSGEVSVGVAKAFIAPDDQFTITGVDEGPLDLLAVTSVPVEFLNAVFADKMIIRRGQNFQDGATIPELDFADAVAAASAQLAINGLTANESSVAVNFATSTGANALTYVSPMGGANQEYTGVHSALTAPGDLHSISINDVAGTPGLERFATVYLRDIGDRTVSLGPSLDVPTVSAPAGSALWRIQVPSKSEYGTFAMASFSQLDPAAPRAASVLVTSAYLGGSPPTTWDISIPDLSAAGFDSRLGLQPSAPTQWFVTTQGGGSLAQFLSPSDGLTLIGSTRSTAQGEAVRSSRTPSSRLIAKLLRRNALPLRRR
ncbi:MAG TPA: hypothetical protein VIP11_20780 [Gemmatimonadaceae bacterium]